MVQPANEVVSWHWAFKKSVLETSLKVNSNKSSLYGAIQYNTLQYVLQEEGRIHYAQKRNSQSGALYYAFEYDYFIRDHLGNVRTVLTEGKDTATYAATMEPADSAVVNALFSNVYTPVRTVYAKPSGFDNNSGNSYVARLNASASENKKVGPSLVLKVMAGDQVQISTYSYYNTAAQSPDPGVNLTSELLNLLSNGIVSNSGGKMLSSEASTVSNASTPAVTQFLASRGYDGSRPKAYLNWILFDNQFNYVASNSDIRQVVSGSSKQVLASPLMTIARNGYLYVYVSNESPQDVYFDDLTVKHYTGPLLQEQSYYPFGLQMAGISDKALNKLSSQYKFNGGAELEEDYGVNLYSTFYRQYDPQIGRFCGVDIKAEAVNSLSAYQFALNDPIMYNDPLGDFMHVPTTFFGDYFDEYQSSSTQQHISGSGGGGGGNRYEAGKISMGSNGVEASGVYAQQLFAAWQDAYNHPNDDGDWSFTVGQNKNGEIGYWETFARDGGFIKGANLQGVEVGARFVSLDGSNPIFGGISTRSFAFKQTGTNWQEAGVYNIKINIRFASPKMGTSVNLIIKNTLIFGLPIERYDGTIYDATDAANISADAVDQAVELTKELLKHSNPSRETVESEFIRFMQLFMLNFGGKVDRTGTGKRINVREAQYDSGFWFH